MSEPKLLSRQSVLRLASVAEIATGALLLVVPALVVQLLLGKHLSADGMPVARVAGAGLLGLGLASWPSAESRAFLPAFRGMLAYNALVSAYLALIAVRHHAGGPLLWPAVISHVMVALLLVWTWREETHPKSSRSEATS
jgi:hypothetical protein